ncbi:serine/threonine protein kinase [Anabaena sphaerica FACHB-251]|uniref:non-specific serine/threonine protein kinase n=1 Tax=Anabaena sphaerica FACHB-251 TaxID=2692883 RepID=A0A926ZZI5_9NOST|nr:serine/threonine-protein kinase [Anabaena sphaerica]MBD2292654.1 serine/threonine protein kinase [Anabaena sphaerica FACHB-251]
MLEFDVNHGDETSNSQNHYPDFSKVGYQVIQELGRNSEGGRIAYLANDINSQQKVVIKEFCFAITTADWSGVKAYEREIELLQRLNHPRIPHYIDSFEKPGFFYLVQEYKKAPSLGFRRCFHPEEIKQIALSILKILVYLQQQSPPIIHRDIKPENILVDQKLQAYLVDFGLAKTQDEKTDLSTLVAGTPGFIPPEEEFGYPLTAASDLYSLGATLICLLTNTRAADIGKLIDDHYRVNFHKLLPHISPGFRSWLKKMVEPNRKQRYANAAEALAALKLIRVMGSGTIIDNFWIAINQRKNMAILGLGAMGILLGLGTSLIISQPGDPVNSNAQLQPNIADNLPKVHFK